MDVIPLAAPPPRQDHIDPSPEDRPRHHLVGEPYPRGSRSQREAAAVLDFRPDGGLPPSILSELVGEWMETLGNALTDPVRSALDNAVAAAAAWPARAVKGSLPGIRVVFGGGPSPLWRQLADAWPRRGTGPVVEDLFSVLARSRFARDPI